VVAVWGQVRSALCPLCNGGIAPKTSQLLWKLLGSGVYIYMLTYKL
jgi:hypothetical protein